MNNAPFSAQGNLAAITAAVSAPVAIPMSFNAGMNPNNIEITNTVSGVDAFLVYAIDTPGNPGTALANAASAAALGIPVGGSAIPNYSLYYARMIHLPAGTDKIYSVPANAYITAITATATSTLYLLLGDGN